MLETKRETERGKERVRIKGREREKEKDTERGRENSLVKNARSTHLEEPEKNRFRKKYTDLSKDQNQGAN